MTADTATYVRALAALLILTAATAGVSFLRLAHGALAVALLIAALKAGVVGAVFMHLRHDSPILRAIPALALLLAAILLGLSALDWFTRDVGSEAGAAQVSGRVNTRLQK
jgi:cytochrome c oxidase subunit 4